jgi:hypothetical protein
VDSSTDKQVARGDSVFSTDAVKNRAARWAAGIPIHFDSSHIATPGQGKKVVETLGPCERACCGGMGINPRERVLDAPEATASVR